MSLLSKITWPRLLPVLHVLLPSLLSILFPPSWLLPAFAPRHLVDSHDLLPLLFAPWAPPRTLLAYLSRCIQAGALWHLPSASIAFWYPVWIYVALARTFVGFILTRSVGWAIPPLFRHYSVYETTSGFGPMLVAYFLVVGTDELVDQLKIRKHVHLIPAATALVFCFLESAPWTYGSTCLFVGGARTAYHLLCTITKRSTHPMMLDRTPPSSPRIALLTIFLVLPAIFIPYRISTWLTSVSLTSMPPSPFPQSPLLDILVLSFPRPDTAMSSKMLAATITSYLPFTNPDITLSVFTHSTEHPAFKQNALLFPNVTFFVDGDSHAEYHTGHYLHLAEAFRWEMERRNQGEWFMLVEDDFPLCEAREKAWSDIARVMRILEGGREEGEKVPRRRGAFVGTGGSGLIIHKTLLPTITHLLLTHALVKSPIAPNVVSRPPDVVMQDCLMGDDPICPSKHDGMLIITSRLVMDHIGGMASTNRNKAKNRDKWRCGWRHPFHGRPEVEVVVVD